MLSRRGIGPQRDDNRRGHLSSRRGEIAHQHRYRGIQMVVDTSNRICAEGMSLQFSANSALKWFEIRGSDQSLLRSDPKSGAPFHPSGMGYIGGRRYLRK